MGRPADQKGGTGFCDTKWKKGLVVTGMTIWAEKFHIKGLLLKYSDGSDGDLHGQATGDRKWTPESPKNALDWGQEESIKNIQMWHNWNDGKGPDGIGRIEVTVGESKKLVVSSDIGKTGGKNRGKTIPVNSVMWEA
jgi:hypothetical protein